MKKRTKILTSIIGTLSLLVGFGGNSSADSSFIQDDEYGYNSDVFDTCEFRFSDEVEKKILSK